MKKLVLAFSLLFAITATAQTINFSQMCVLSIGIDTANNELDVTIYNGSSEHVNYPTVVVVDAVGDTVGNINNLFYLFAHMPGDTVTHSIETSLDTLPSGFTGGVYFTDQVWDTTYLFPFPMACTVGISEVASTNAINIYPNPADDVINIDFTNTNNSEAIIRVYDVLGKTQISTSTTSNKLSMNSSELQSGMYLVNILLDGKNYTRKLIVR